MCRFPTRVGISVGGLQPREALGSTRCRASRSRPGGRAWTVRAGSGLPDAFSISPQLGLRLDIQDNHFNGLAVSSSELPLGGEGLLSCLVLQVGAWMHSVDKLPRRAGGNVREFAELDHQFDPVAFDDNPARTKQLGNVALFEPLARVPSWGWIAGGIVVLLLLAFAGAVSLLQGPTTSARQGAPVAEPASDPPATDSAAATPPLQPTDSDRRVVRVIPIHPSTDQRSTVATATPRNTPPGEQAHDPPPQTGISPPSVTTSEESSQQQLDLGQVEAARQVQQRLIELGYLFGTADGVWGTRSRKALQDFRIANGIGDNDTWDGPTQERLFAASDAIAADPNDVSFIGGWGVDVAQCRESPLTITASRAEAFGAACEFHSTQRESASVWRLRAQCGNSSERWNANIRFALSGDKLTWTSERGTTTYRRCPS